jgi:hypothetical protein
MPGDRTFRKACDIGDSGSVQQDLLITAPRFERVRIRVDGRVSLLNIARWCACLWISNDLPAFSASRFGDCYRAIGCDGKFVQYNYWAMVLALQVLMTQTASQSLPLPVFMFDDQLPMRLRADLQEVFLFDPVMFSECDVDYGEM